MIEILLILSQLATTEITDKVAPKYWAEATAWSVDLYVEKTDAKLTTAIAELKADKQIVGKNPGIVYAVIVRGLNGKGEMGDRITSGSFATKEDAPAWFETLKKKAAEVPDILPKEATFTLHTCDHSENGSGKGGCKEEELKP